MKTAVRKHPTRFIPDWLEALGARPNFAAGGYDCTLQTEAGPLSVSVYDDWVACRFEDVDRAKALLPHGYHDRLNRHTGKWNHLYIGWSPRDALAAFVAAINEVL